MTKTYIGYSTLEEAVSVFDPQAPVYASPITRPGTPDRKFGVRLDRYEVVVAQPDERGDVHYCVIPVGLLQVMPGNEDGFGKRPALIQRQESAWTLVEDWLLGLGFTVRMALIAFPTHLRLCDGSAEFMRYDKTTDRFEPQ